VGEAMKTMIVLSARCFIKAGCLYLVLCGLIRAMRGEPYADAMMILGCSLFVSFTWK
jgi:hypothetical protein